MAGVLAQTSLQQVWLGHLLALSMVGEWDTGLFVLVYPAANTSIAGVANRYPLGCSTPPPSSAARWRS